MTPSLPEPSTAFRDRHGQVLHVPASPWRRLAAFALDYLVVALYIGLLAAVMFTVARPLVEAVSSPLLAHLLGTATLTLPVALYFALCHHFAAATVGKQLLGLRVVTTAGDPLPLSRSLLRAAIKFAPWELAHFALYRVAGWPLAPEPLALWQYIVFHLSIGLAFLFVFSLFRARGRPPYDVVSGTIVAEVIG